MDTSSLFQYDGADVKRSRQSLVMFADVTAAEWSVLLGYTQTRRFRPDEWVIRQGEEDDSLLFTGCGELEVLLPVGRNNRLRRLAVIGSGSVIGEQSFFDHQPRSTSIRALTAGELYRLTHDSYLTLSAREPRLARMLVFELGRIVSLRLRDTTRFLSQGITYHGH